MKNKEILTIASLSCLGVFLVSLMTKKVSGVIKNGFFLLAAILLGVSQLSEGTYNRDKSEFSYASDDPIKIGFYAGDIAGPCKLENNMVYIKSLKDKGLLSKLIVGLVHFGRGTEDAPILGSDGKTPIPFVPRPPYWLVECKNSGDTCWPSNVVGGEGQSVVASINQCKGCGKCSFLTKKDCENSCKWSADKTGDIILNDTRLISEGKPVNEARFNTWISNLKKLYEYGIELSWSIGGGGDVSDFFQFELTSIRDKKFSTQSIIYKNLEFLHNKTPFINWLDLDDEEENTDPAYALAELWKNLDKKNKISVSTPRSGSPFGSVLKKKLVDLINYQCYCGGENQCILNLGDDYWGSTGIPTTVGFCFTNDCTNCPQSITTIKNYIPTLKAMKNFDGIFIWDLEAFQKDKTNVDSLKEIIQLLGDTM